MLEPDCLWEQKDWDGGGGKAFIPRWADGKAEARRHGATSCMTGRQHSEHCQCRGGFGGPERSLQRQRSRQGKERLQRLSARQLDEAAGDVGYPTATKAGNRLSSSGKQRLSSRREAGIGCPAAGKQRERLSSRRETEDRLSSRSGAEQMEQRWMLIADAN